MSTKSARVALAIALGCAGSVGVGVGTAHAVTPYACPAAQSLSTQTPSPGQTVTAVLSCFGAGESIQGALFSQPVNIFTTTANGTGGATATFQVPLNVCGVHSVVATGQSTHNTASTIITVVGCKEHGRHHDGGHRKRHHDQCDDWRDPGYWIDNCDTEGGDDGWEDGWYDDDSSDAAYSDPLTEHGNSHTASVGVLGLGLLGPALLGGTVAIARRRKH